MPDNYILIKSKAIYTGGKKMPFPGGVVIEKNRINAVCSEDEIKKFEETDMEVWDFGEKLVMPGFVDAHVHFTVGAISASDHMCTAIADSQSEEEAVEIIRDYAVAHPEEKRIMGIGWFPANWKDGPLPSKDSLDRDIPDKPVYMISADAHTFWMNSKALEEAGITENMTPKSGSIGKAEDGSLNGLLFEPDAYRPAMNKVMEFEKKELKNIYKKFVAHMNACGVTSVSEMSADDYHEGTYRNYDVIKEIEDEGGLNCRLHIYTKLDGYTQWDMAKSLQQKYCSEKLKVSGLKGFIDGVTSTYTGLLLEPYADRPETCGEMVPMASYEDNEKYVVSANAAGLPVRLHCIADGSVRMALDLFEASQRINGNHEQINTIEHIENIHPDDIPRFAALGVVPSMQPYHLVLDFDEKIRRLGKERCKWEWPMASFIKSGARLAFGTDYPVVDFNPFPSIHAAVTRSDDENKPTGANPQESISMVEAMEAYTSGAAHAYSRDDIGVLEEGKLADLIVVDRNIFQVNPENISNAKVELTMMDGKVVYKKEGEII